MKKNSNSFFMSGSLMLVIVSLSVSAVVGFVSNGSPFKSSDDGSVEGTSTLQPTIQATQEPSPLPTPIVISENESAVYSADEFVQAFYDVELPNLIPLYTNPSLVGNEQADDRLRVIAESKGYKKQRLVDDVTKLVTRSNIMLQPQVWDDWDALKAQAASEGVILGLISGYRSIETQQILFNSRLSSQAKSFYDVTITIESIVYGEADEAIRFTLQGTALPGYSKHQTGYALDMTDVGSGLDFTEFGKTEGFEWISKDNYANARKFGFIPSYPDGAAELGPDPEPWEFVWIGGSGEIRTLGQ